MVTSGSRGGSVEEPASDFSNITNGGFRQDESEMPQNGRRTGEEHYVPSSSEASLGWRDKRQE